MVTSLLTGHNPLRRHLCIFRLTDSPLWRRCGRQRKKLQLMSCVGMYVYRVQNFFYVVRHLDSIASYLPTGLHLGFFRSWPSLFLPSSFCVSVKLCQHSDDYLGSFLLDTEDVRNLSWEQSGTFLFHVRLPLSHNLRIMKRFQGSLWYIWVLMFLSYSLECDYVAHTSLTIFFLFLLSYKKNFLHTREKEITTDKANSLSFCRMLLS